MKIGIAQINPIVGDFKGNAKRILEAYRACIDSGAELVVTPELSLVGYPAGGLIQKVRFVEQCQQALDYIADETKEVGLLIGHVDFNYYEASERMGKPYRNCASLLYQGAVRGTVHKTLLPTYDVYDEHQYFEPSESCEPLEFNGVKLGVTICEDLWCDEIVARPIFDRNPAEELKDKGADVIINMSASAFQVGKPQFKANLLEVYACGIGLPVVYCNAVGGNDQFIFDGHSMFLDSDGNSVADLPGFKQCIKVCDFNEKGERAPVIRGRSIEHLLTALELGIQDYVRKLGFEKVCIAMSGGIDSSLVATLAVRALGSDRVIGLTMPSKYNPNSSTSDALKLAGNLRMECEIVPINSVLEGAIGSMSSLFRGLESDHTEENMQSRIRAMFLMALSNKHDYLVLGTGNKSETFIGNYATYGDVSIGLSVLADVPKNLIYKLAEEINKDREVIPQSIIDKEPSAELAEGQVDSQRIPNYKDLDNILEYYVIYGKSVSEIVEDFGYDEATVRWVQRRVDLNEWKRQQSAPVLRVTSPSAGRGRRIPIVQRFVD